MFTKISQISASHVIHVLNPVDAALAVVDLDTGTYQVPGYKLLLE